MNRSSDDRTGGERPAARHGPLSLCEDLRGKSALVTGASSGLGRFFAQCLARRGVAVTLAARNGKALEEACRTIADAGGRARPVEMDVTERSSIEGAIAGMTTGIDILVNNAGISLPGPALTMPAEDWDRQLATNLTGVFLVAQAAAARMQAEGRRGSIVNIASILGLRVAGAVSAYAASKAGVIHLTMALALEWARHGIRVNALCPGYIETELNRAFLNSEQGQALVRRIPQRRLGRLEELEMPLLLLCSDAGSYITGAALAVDGGHLVSSL